MAKENSFTLQIPFKKSWHRLRIGAAAPIDTFKTSDERQV